MKFSTRFPVYSAEEPELWFTQMEAIFEHHEITSDKAQYTYTLSAHPVEASAVTSPPTAETQACTALKAALLQR